MRWTRQYRKTNDAGCGRRSRVVLMPRRWHQVRQASDERQWQKSPVTGESAKETVKTIARETPGNPGEPVVTNSPCFTYFRTRGCGCIEHPAFPAPSFFLGETKCITRAQFAPRERAILSCPALCRASTSSVHQARKTWMAGSSARSKASSPRPAMTEKVFK